MRYVRDGFAIVRDALIILFLVAALVMGMSIVNGIKDATDTPAIDTGTVQCLGEEVCPETLPAPIPAPEFRLTGRPTGVVVVPAPSPAASPVAPW